MLKISNLNFSYGKNKVLKDISFEIFDSGVYGLIGANGAGKSTLLEVISTIRGSRFEGEIAFNQLSQKKNFNKFRQEIGILFQNESLEEKLTVIETFNYFRSLYQNKSGFYTNDELLKIFNLYEHKNKLIRQLSGGLKQRVRIAVTCMNKPKLILLDEPTTGLNPMYRRDFWKVLQMIVQENNVLILLSTHDMHELESYAKKIIYIDGGKIKAFDSVPNLLKFEKVDSLENYYLKMEDNFAR